MSRKKYNRIEEPLPLQWIDRIQKAFPATWKIYDECVREFNKKDYTENKILNLTICSRILLTIPNYIKPESANASIDAAMIHALGAWRSYKEVYQIDSELADVLINYTSDNIDGITLQNLARTPYPSFYVACDKIANGGFYFTYEVSTNTARFFTMKSDGQNGISMGIRLDGTDLLTSIKNRLEAQGHKYYDMEQHDYNMDFLKSAIQIVLYLCSINCDINENPEQKKIYHRTSHVTNSNRLKEVRKWDIGYRVGSAMTNIQPNATHRGGKHSTSSPKRPHIRRGHFHRFWTGPKSGERVEVLKWVAPAYVNMTADEMPAVINKIK